MTTSYGLQEGPARMRVQRALLQLMMQLLLATWSARIRYHGPRPGPAPNRVRCCSLSVVPHNSSKACMQWPGCHKKKGIPPLLPSLLW